MAGLVPARPLALSDEDNGSPLVPIVLSKNIPYRPCSVRGGRHAPHEEIDHRLGELHVVGTLRLRRRLVDRHERKNAARHHRIEPPYEDVAGHFGVEVRAEFATGLTFSKDASDRLEELADGLHPIPTEHALAALDLEDQDLHPLGLALVDRQDALGDRAELVLDRPVVAGDRPDIGDELAPSLQEDRVEDLFLVLEGTSTSSSVLR